MVFIQITNENEKVPNIKDAYLEANTGIQTDDITVAVTKLSG